MKATAYFGNPWIGIFMKSNNTHTLVPIDIMDKTEIIVREKLETETIRLLVGGSNLLGLYIAMNSNGAILPNIADEKEILAIKKLGINVYRSRDKNNAHGNNISVNDRGGVINSAISSIEKGKIEDVLGVELVATNIANYPTVGSCVVATNKGFLAHFRASESEFELLEKIFKVNGGKGSVNTGTGFVSLGIIANDNGYVVGEKTTAFEMGRAEETLGFI